MAGNSAETGRSVTSKITSILLTFNQGSEHSLTEIARLAGLPISTAHRLTAELASWRLLERTDDGRYRAGLPLRTISTNSDDGPPRVPELAPWVLDDLCAVTNKQARVGVLHDLKVAYIEKQPGRAPSSLFAGAAKLPVHPTAVGRAILAFSSPRTVELIILQGLHPYTRHTITSPEKFRRALAVTRLTRVATSRRELDPRTCGIAMPVFGPGGDVVAAIELTLDDLGQEMQSVLPALSVASRSLSRELAGQTPAHPATEPPTATPHDPAVGGSQSVPRTHIQRK